ncbi:MAG: hypothetical protein COW24_03150 [Candidatus Kerfeldbacteria bacterium CG15_BIG_FIL_POST_REV_8_21_14_020_45_12]|uniref:Cytochrome b5 heme-binding domain-containing protein n=1 Tax=Candidatus Kerfeldbacteria bacterium CG15_BIG_FIL_POST_REV_8_21_14_020_45_12 TaxID=2014247 RepID=A0A2M7H3Y6_9BACT|nr:MAG: hypothetical protein COW24_03150 [Candidatus Kerfeldbacteria bacterium CG15_BIG_FIL_POST_REV_8_21_14_020_45_12]PJA92771.1 MAG: hypothetical protein CO132_06300 [Candidatus Kerfeldbacteria bacterium CG_4_9_14_3_um_filter_45_8]
MKKITLVALVIFTIIVVGVGILGVLFPPVKSNTVPSKSANVNGVNQGATTQSETAGISKTEISKHSTASDCYLLINGNVYDVSAYIGVHPGGSSSITSRCGGEVTSIFTAIHSNFAWNLLGKYYIGPLETTVATGSTADTGTSAQDVFTVIQTALLDKYPNAEIIATKPSKSYYVSKLIYQGTLYEVHTDALGTVLGEEVQDDENDWTIWDTDADDLE